MLMKKESSSSQQFPLLKSRLIEKSPIFYGWWVLVVGALGLALTMPGQTAVVSVFWDYIMADLDVSRQTITLMYTSATVCASFVLPWVGRMIDARGPRFAVVTVSIAFALACFFMGVLRSVTLLFVGFFFLRLLGQGSLAIVSQHAINLWFIRQRGLAIGLSGIGLALGLTFIPKLSEAWIIRFGWHQAYMLLGVLIACTILPLGWLIFRRHPEKYGILPDGIGFNAEAKPDAAQTNEEPLVEERNFTAKEARGTFTFWIFLLGAMNFSGLITALQLNNTDILASQQLANATDVFVSLGIVSALFNFMAGVLLDRIQPKYILMASQLGLAACLIMSTQLTGTLSVYIYGGLMGISQGITAALNAVVFAHYFGRLHLGSIKGFVATLSVIATAIGPLIFALGFRWLELGLGRYTLIAWLCALLPLAVAAVAPFIREPHPESMETSL